MTCEGYWYCQYKRKQTLGIEPGKLQPIQKFELHTLQGDPWHHWAGVLVTPVLGEGYMYYCEECKGFITFPTVKADGTLEKLKCPGVKEMQVRFDADRTLKVPDRKCTAEYDFQKAKGATFVHCETSKVTLCEDCFKHVLQSITGGRSGQGTRRQKQYKKDYQEQNEEILYEYLATGECSVCGEDQHHKLVAVTTDKSPSGTAGSWKRTVRPETFKEKLQTTRLVCRSCLPNLNKKS